MKNKRNYYRILHVQPDAPVELIRMSYRTIMQKLKKHPDLGGDEWDASVINEAYSVLSDKKLRKAYDERLLRERSMADAAVQSKSQRGSEGERSQRGSEGEKTQRGSEGEKSQRDSANETEDTASAQAQQGEAHAANDGNACLFCSLAYEGTASEERDCAACNSPLLLLDPQVMERNSQRTIQRQPNYCPLEIHAFWPGSAQASVLADLSPNGLKFRFANALQPGHVLKIHCALFTGVVKVAHCVEADAAFLLGAKFLSVRFAAQQGTFVSTSA